VKLLRNNMLFSAATADRQCRVEVNFNLSQLRDEATSGYGDSSALIDLLPVTIG